MSNTALTHVWTHSKQSGTHLLVMIALADASNNDGICWWGKTKLSERCRLTEARLKTVIRDLERAGELQVIEGGYDKEAKKNISNHYLIMGLAEPSAEARPIEPAKPKKRNFEKRSEADGGNTVDPHMGAIRLTPRGQDGLPPVGNTVDPQGGYTVDPKPSLEPSLIPPLTQIVSANAESAQPNEPPKEPEKPKTKGGKPKGETVPRPEFNAMCDAIVAAHKYPEIVWKTDMAGVIRDTAKTLCLAGYKPEHISIIHAACKQKFTDFSPAAMAKHAATILDPTKPVQSQNGNGTHAATPNQPRHARAPRQMTPEEIAAEDAKWAAMNAPEGGAS